MVLKILCNLGPIQVEISKYGIRRTTEEWRAPEYCPFSAEKPDEVVLDIFAFWVSMFLQGIETFGVW
jgi:hypothetical protein